MTSLALSFNEVNFSAFQENGQIWLTASELAKALGYSKSNAVTQVYERNQDEFSLNMTKLIQNPQNLNLRLRVFSLRGAHLIAMFSKTVIAKQFRKWVLDVLDKEVANPKTEIIKTTKEERVPLKDAVNMLVGKAEFLNYSDAYKLIHQRFDVKHIEEISYEDMPKVIEYVHHLIGEYIPRVGKKEDYELKALKILEADTVGKVMEYLNCLCMEVKRLGGQLPSYPYLNEEAIVSAIVTRIVDSSRMFLTIDTSGKPNISLIPNNTWTISNENIVSFIGDPLKVKKDLLPDVIKAAATRLSK